MLILDLQEDYPSAVLLGTESAPEISGIHMDRSEEAISADLTWGI